MNKNADSLVFISGILFLGVLACSTSAFPAPQAPAQAAEAQAPQAAALSETVVLASSPFTEQGQTPAYKITAQIPFLDPSTDARVQNLNIELKDMVQKELDAFKSNLAGAAVTPAINGSSFDVRYELISQKGDIWSLKFNIEGYTDGAAHPYHYSIPVNYDLGNGRHVSLDEVFQPNSNYLQAVSEYCKAQLMKRDIGFDGFQAGAEPTPQNYQIWNFSEHGLLFTFDEYQVAPYAAGPQTVLVPFSELAGLVNPDGPIAPYLPK